MINTLAKSFEHEQNNLNWRGRGGTALKKLNGFVRFEKNAKKLLGGQLAPFAPPAGAYAVMVPTIALYNGGVGAVVSSMSTVSRRHINFFSYPILV